MNEEQEEDFEFMLGSEIVQEYAAAFE